MSLFYTDDYLDDESSEDTPGTYDFRDNQTSLYDWSDLDDDYETSEEFANAWEAGDSTLFPKAAVSQWRILAVGHRPKDFMARDCLYSPLWRDRRVPWFRKYMKRPANWMRKLVDHVSNKSDRFQALQCVVLDYLHKAHLARLYAPARDEYGEDSQTVALIRRLWQCAPYTVQVERRSGFQKHLHGCGYPRLCPWCFARKVVDLYRWVQKGPLKNKEGKFILLGKPVPFPEPSGGINGRWQQADYNSLIDSELVRGHYGRYFGLQHERLYETRQALARLLRAVAAQYGVVDGLVAHQIGSAQLENEQRTFLHDLGLVAELSADAAQAIKKGNKGSATWEIDDLPLQSNLTVSMQWAMLPANHPYALRVALTGGSVKYLYRRFDTQNVNTNADTKYPVGIRGALSWQPTFLLDDQMWFPYYEGITRRHLYTPFGSWRQSLAAVASDARKSIGTKFASAQATRHARKRQQAGNQTRQLKAQSRRNELLDLAQSLWDQVRSEAPSGRGRPSYRRRLAARLGKAGVIPSRRDLQWVMRQLA